MESGLTVRLSIVMAMRNAEATIAQTLESLLGQSFTDWELILLDDGSQDASVALARGYADARIQIFADHRSRGLAARLNEAVALSRGALIARMDADDIAYPERLARQVAYLDAHPEVDLLGTGAIVFDNAGEVVGALPMVTEHQAITARPWAGFYLPHPTWMGRRYWFVKYGYDERALKSQDYELLLRSHRTSRFACLPEILLGYRQDVLSLRKIFDSRIQTVRAIARQAVRQKEYAWMVRGVAGQCLKFAVDAVAISTGLNYRLLRHRALAVSVADCAAWRQVWQDIQRKVDRQCAA